MAGRQLVLDFFPGLGEVENLDAAARRHDILDRDVVEVEQAGQDGPVFLWNQMGGFENQAAQFLGRQVERA